MFVKVPQKGVCYKRFDERTKFSIFAGEFGVQKDLDVVDFEVWVTALFFFVISAKAIFAAATAGGNCGGAMKA